MCRIGYRITHAGILYVLKTCRNIAYHSGTQFLTRNKLSGPKITNFYYFCLSSCRHHKDRCSFFYSSFFDSAKYDNTFIRII